MNTKPNCTVPKFNLEGYACKKTNTLFVLDLVNGYLPYMPLDEAVRTDDVKFNHGVARNAVIETELGKEKQCSVCKDFWPLDPEFFFTKTLPPKKNGERNKSYDSVCKACYEIKYRKRKPGRRNNIRSSAEKLVAA